MRALTLHQPWASAIAHGPKRLENRPRPWPSTIKLPAWIAIHAGQRYDEEGAKRCGLLWPDTPTPEEAVHGAIVAIAKVVACVPSTDPRLADNPWADGPWCYVLDEVVALDRPIPMRGYQGFWIAPDTHGRILELIGLATDLPPRARSSWWTEKEGEAP